MEAKLAGHFDARSASFASRVSDRSLSGHVAGILREIEAFKAERKTEAALRARAMLASPWFSKARRRG